MLYQKVLVRCVGWFSQHEIKISAAEILFNFVNIFYFLAARAKPQEKNKGLDVDEAFIF